MASLQIGDNRKIFIVEPKLAGLTDQDLPVAFINPEVLEASDEIQDSEEGCLSFPDIYIKVKRPMRTRVRASASTASRSRCRAKACSHAASCTRTIT